MTTKIRYPDQSELDGPFDAASGWRCFVYLVPVAEADGDVPELVVNSGYGTIGTPVSAWHGLWTSVSAFGPGTVGTVALQALEAAEPELLALARCYLGSEWDGSNHKGRWQEQAYLELGQAIEERIQGYLQDRDDANYWDGGQWLESSSLTDIAASAGLTTPVLVKAFRAEVRSVIDVVVRSVEEDAAADGYYVMGVEKAIADKVEDLDDAAEA